MRPSVPPGLSGSQPAESRGTALYSHTGVSPIEYIRDSRKHKASEDVLDTFSGPPKKCDPDHVKLKGTGWTMAQRVFHPSDVWPTKDANAFMAKNLTLVPNQKKELESDLVQESFLED